MATEAEEDDDYMSMSFADPEPTAPMSSLQRKQHLRKQAEQRSRPKSKKELEAEAVAKRDAALSQSLDPSNKGAKLMAKLGYKGGALGKSEDARTQPIQVQIKDDRGGIGADSEKKRKMREHMDALQGREKRIKADEGEFRERNRREREEKRNEGMMWAAMRIAEKFDTEAQEDHKDKVENDGVSEQNSPGGTEKPAEAVEDDVLRFKPNILWRALVRQRADREKERKLRHEMTVGLSTRSKEEEADLDDDDKIALGTEIEDYEEEGDQELDDFTALDAAERLEKIVQYLRDTYNYCFWCKYRYPDAGMEGCPGTTEEEHD